MRDEVLSVSSLNSHLSTSLLCHSIGDPEPSPGIAPAGKGVAMADDIAGATLQAAVMHESHLLFLFRPGVATGGTGVGTAAVVTIDTDGLVKNDVRFTVNGKAGHIENFVNIHSALQAFRPSAISFPSPTLSIALRRKRLVIFFLGLPSIL